MKPEPEEDEKRPSRVTVRKVFSDPADQIEFEQSLLTGGHWKMCIICREPFYFVPGFVVKCQKCGPGQEAEIESGAA